VQAVQKEVVVPPVHLVALVQLVYQGVPVCKEPKELLGLLDHPGQLEVTDQREYPEEWVNPAAMGHPVFRELLAKME